MQTFMDVFQGSYKDGSNDTHDCQWFTSLYLLLRIAVLMAYAINTDLALCIAILLLLVAVFLTTIFHPHKSPIYNITDTFLLLILICIGILIISAQAVRYTVALHSGILLHILFDTFLCIPLLCFIAVLFCKLLACKNSVWKVYRKLCLTCNCRQANDEELYIWPDRLINTEEYTPLLSTEAVEN